MTARKTCLWSLERLGHQAPGEDNQDSHARSMEIQVTADRNHLSYALLAEKPGMVPVEGAVFSRMMVACERLPRLAFIINTVCRAQAGGEFAHVGRSVVTNLNLQGTDC